MKNGYQIVHEAVSFSIDFYHYLFPTNNLTSKEILQQILKDKEIKPGSSIEGTESKYLDRDESHKRESDVVYLTPHKLYVPGVYRFIVPEYTLKDYKVQLKKHIYPKEALSKLLKSIKEDPQVLFDRYKDRKFRGLIQILYHGSISIHGLKYYTD